MDIYIHTVDGAVLEYPSLPHHLSAPENLSRLGYRIVRLPVPPGDYGGGMLCPVRREDVKCGEYAAGSVDVAEIDVAEIAAPSTGARQHEGDGKAEYVIAVGESGSEIGHETKEKHVSDQSAVQCAKRKAQSYCGNGWWRVETATGELVARGGRRYL